MLNRILIFLVIFFNFSLNLRANEKQLIINRLINIDNITFDFEQVTNKKKEVGSCVLSFDSKLVCDYKDSTQKHIIMKVLLLIRHDQVHQVAR